MWLEIVKLYRIFLCVVNIFQQWFFFLFLVAASRARITRVKNENLLSQKLNAIQTRTEITFVLS